jgi:hypothetical protein
MSGSPGSRVRRRARPTFGQRVRTVAPPVAAALLLALAFVLPNGSEADRSPAPVTITRSAYACPGGSGVSVSAGQVKAGTSATATGLPGRTPVESLGDATRWRTDTVDAAAVAMDQRGRGSGAVGFFSEVASKQRGGGLVVGSCPPTADDSWFLGAGSGGKHLTSLVLTNLSSAPAVADVTFWGPAGRIDAVDAGGIVVDPFTAQRVDLSDLAAGEAELAVRVERRRGSLAVSALDSATSVFRGTDALEPTAPPRRQQVVAGIPSGSATRTLLLLNPSTSTARVRVDVIGEKGTFAPEGLDSIKVDARQLLAVTVPKSVGSDEAALRLRSDQPIAASVRVAPGTRDRAVVEASPELDGAAVVPVDLGIRTREPQLVLTAAGRKGRVTLEAYDEEMSRQATTDVTVEAGTTKSLDLGSAKVLDAKDVAYVVVRAEGRVTGAATYELGVGIASLALTEAPVTVLGPQVRPVG